MFLDRNNSDTVIILFVISLGFLGCCLFVLGGHASLVFCVCSFGLLFVCFGGSCIIGFLCLFFCILIITDIPSLYLAWSFLFACVHGLFLLSDLYSFRQNVISFNLVVCVISTTTNQLLCVVFVDRKSTTSQGWTRSAERIFWPETWIACWRCSPRSTTSSPRHGASLQSELSPHLPQRWASLV